MSETALPQSPTNATYVEPSAETILEPGLKLGDLLRRNMTQPYVLQRLAERVWWVQSFNYGTVFYVGDEGVLIFDTLEGVYDNITQAVASVTDKPITAAVYPHYHADHIGDIDKYVAAAEAAGPVAADLRQREDPPVDGVRRTARSPGRPSRGVAAGQLRVRGPHRRAARLRVGRAHRRPLGLALTAGPHHPLVRT